MARPRDLPIVDLMVELPRGGSGMGMDEARRLLKDAGSDDFSHHPAEYLFKDAGDRMGETLSIDGLVALMDHHGIASAQIDVNPVRPEEFLEIAERFPGRFIGSVGIDPNLGMKSLRSMKRAVESHPDIRSVSAAPCLYAPQVPIDAALMYPFYAACCELGVPINCLAGVPGPRVPFDCQKVERIDRVCYDFPELVFVMRHGCEPWEELAVKLMLKWPNLYFSTTAFAPKHYPQAIIDYANTRGADKVMFAGYFPGLSWDRVLRELDDLPLRDHVWEPFLAGNARRVFGVDG
ncbi:MAG: amidohydrolase family protein [Actinomycetota bacterium]